jgi:hypothetical protein
MQHRIPTKLYFYLTFKTPHKYKIHLYEILHKKIPTIIFKSFPINLYLILNVAPIIGDHLIRKILQSLMTKRIFLCEV